MKRTEACCGLRHKGNSWRLNCTSAQVNPILWYALSRRFLMKYNDLNLRENKIEISLPGTVRHWHLDKSICGFSLNAAIWFITKLYKYITHASTNIKEVGYTYIAVREIIQPTFISWWRHRIESFQHCWSVLRKPALLALSGTNTSADGGFQS